MSATSRDLVLPPFEPPYALLGRAWILVGFYESERHVPLPPGFRALRLFGRDLAIVVVSDFTDPPAEMPIPYRELIVARLVRRGLGLAVQPLDMLLDHETPVELGHLHYGMPKRYMPDLSADLVAAHLRVRGDGVSLHGERRGALVSALSLPARAFFTLATWALTSALDVLGLRDPGEIVRAKVALEPRSLGHLTRVREVRLPDLHVMPLWGQAFERVVTHLGPPRREPSKASGASR